MGDIWFRLLLGHLVGDYLLQWHKLALRKAEEGWVGALLCLLHCVIYTASVCLFVWCCDPLFVCLIFMSHWTIDRFSLGAWWLKAIRGRSVKGAMEDWERNTNQTLWLNYTSEDDLKKSSRNIVDIVFGCIVYVVVDNTLHLVLMWGIVKWLVV